MVAARAAYRVTQFFRTVRDMVSPVDEAYAAARLSPALRRVFKRMSRVDRLHCIAVCRTLERRGWHDPDLLTAALLHDAGKALAPPRLWERVLAVLMEHFAPRLASRWAAGEPRGWRRSFVIRVQHPAWGAAMAQEAGASERVVSLIRRHHDPAPSDPLLQALQEADE